MESMINSILTMIPSLHSFEILIHRYILVAIKQAKLEKIPFPDNNIVNSLADPHSPQSYRRPSLRQARIQIDPILSDTHTYKAINYSLQSASFTCYEVARTSVPFWSLWEIVESFYVK